MTFRVNGCGPSFLHNFCRQVSIFLGYSIYKVLHCAPHRTEYTLPHSITFLLHTLYYYCTAAAVPSDYYCTTKGLLSTLETMMGSTFKTMVMGVLLVCLIARNTLAQVELPDLPYDQDALEPWISNQVKRRGPL